MIRINRASNILGIKGTIPIRPETLRPNKNYTIEEKVLLLYLLSLPPQWNLKQDWVIRMYDEIVGRDKVKKAWAGLKLKGHLFKKRGKKFTDVYWIVYEIPPNDWNPEDQELVDGEPNNNNTNNKETNNKETDITRTSILGKTGLEPKPIENKTSSVKKPNTIFETYKKQFDDAVCEIYDGAKIGEEVFSYLDYDMFGELSDRIGVSTFNQIKSAVEKFKQAKKNLGY
ncbi:MAG: hypothetical protein FJY17_03450 [Bacteroidetes bacterium]|nr:hypothetical protein [Bacteroidota bacterium]